jgi:hypothetical protein
MVYSLQANGSLALTRVELPETEGTNFAGVSKVSLQLGHSGK